jgi:hypothetical protein
VDVPVDRIARHGAGNMLDLAEAAHHLARGALWHMSGNIHQLQRRPADTDRRPEPNQRKKKFLKLPSLKYHPIFISFYFVDLLVEEVGVLGRGCRVRGHKGARVAVVVLVRTHAAVATRAKHQMPLAVQAVQLQALGGDCLPAVGALRLALGQRVVRAGHLHGAAAIVTLHRHHILHCDKKKQKKKQKTKTKAMKKERKEKTPQP